MRPVWCHASMKMNTSSAAIPRTKKMARMWREEKKVICRTYLYTIKVKGKLNMMFSIAKEPKNTLFKWIDIYNHTKTIDANAHIKSESTTFLNYKESTLRLNGIISIPSRSCFSMICSLFWMISSQNSLNLAFWDEKSSYWLLYFLPSISRGRPNLIIDLKTVVFLFPDILKSVPNNFLCY